MQQNCSGQFTAANAPDPPSYSPLSNLTPKQPKSESPVAAFSSSTPQSHPRRLDRCTRPNTQVFGHIDGVSIGQAWTTRMEVSQAGVHGPYQAGIAGTEDRGGAESIVLNGGYPDGDCGNIIWYMGSGGFKNPLTGNKSSIMMQDQQPENASNRAMQESYRTGNPVRVIRGFNDTKSPWAPSSGYRYDGLYKVTHAATIVDPSGFTSYKCLVWRLQRIPSKYVIPIKPAYVSRALERSKIGLYRKNEEDQAAATQPQYLQSISPQLSSHTSNIFEVQIHNKQPLTNPRLFHIAQRSNHPQKTSSKLEPPSRTNEPSPHSAKFNPHYNQGAKLSDMTNVLKQIKIKKTSHITPHSTNLSTCETRELFPSTGNVHSLLPAPSESLQPAWSASSAPGVSFSPCCTIQQELCTTPSANRRCASRGSNSIGCETIQLPTLFMPPVHSIKQASSSTFQEEHLFKSVPALKPLALPEAGIVKINDEMESDMLHSTSPSPFFKAHSKECEKQILSPLPLNDFTYEIKHHVKASSPVSHSYGDSGSYEVMDETPIEHGFKELTIESSFRSPLSATSSMDTNVTDVNPGILTHCKAQDNKIKSNDLLLVREYAGDQNLVHKSNLKVTPSPPQQQSDNNVEHLDPLNTSLAVYNHNSWLDGIIMKDELDGTPIDYDISQQKYLVGGFELIDQMDDDCDSLSECNDVDLFLVKH